MKNLTTYILEKFQITKDSKPINDIYTFTENNILYGLTVSFPIKVHLPETNKTYNVVKIQCEPDRETTSHKYVYVFLLEYKNQLIQFLKLSSIGVKRLFTSKNLSYDQMAAPMVYYDDDHQYIGTQYRMYVDNVDECVNDDGKEILNSITEKFQITKDTKAPEYDTDELRRNYDKVWHATTKKEKQEIADMYGCDIIKIKDIQLRILDLLRENRQKKTTYDEYDAKDFFRYDIPDAYAKLSEYLDKEPIEFVKYLLEFSKDKAKGALNRFRAIGRFSGLSSADRHLLNRKNFIHKYLDEHK